VNQFLEAAGIALSAIWGNKLRSFMTVLGNIVAVTSIIAVVSLVQGMNAYVADAIISDVGADNFTIQRVPPVRTEAEMERTRNNPRVTLDDATAIRRFSDHVQAVAAQAQTSAGVSYGGETLATITIQGVTREYINFATFTAEQGRLISPIEVDRGRPVVLLGWQTADRLFGPPIRSTRSSRSRAALPRRRRQREEGRGLRPVAGRVRGHPARACSRSCSARARACSCSSSRAPPSSCRRRWTTPPWRCGSSAGCAPAEPDNFGMFSSDIAPRPLLQASPAASSRCSSASWRCRSWSAASSS
jgi:hypothetical protein